MRFSRRRLGWRLRSMRESQRSSPTDPLLETQVLVWWGFAQSQLAKQDFAGSLDSCARARRALADHGGAPLVEAAIRETEATLAFQLGKLAEAYALESQVLEAREGCCADSLWTAVGFNALGLFAWRQGRYADAEQSLTRALAIEEVHGRQGAAYVTMLSNFSALSAEHGDLATAERMGRRALEIQERRDPMSLETAQTVLNLAIVYAQRGDLATADALNARGLRIYDLKDPQSVDRGTILMNLGIDAQLRGDLDSAQHLLRQADDIFRGVQTAEAQDWRPRNLMNLSNVAMARGDFAGAVEYARQSVDQWKRLDARAKHHTLSPSAVWAGLSRSSRRTPTPKKSIGRRSRRFNPARPGPSTRQTYTLPLARSPSRRDRSPRPRPNSSRRSRSGRN